MVLGLKYGSREGDGREKLNAAYGIVRRFLDEFTRRRGAVLCRELLSGCNLMSDEGQKYFREHNLREKCWDFVRDSCEILEEFLAERPATP
jgi:hypothetical protein